MMKKCQPAQLGMSNKVDIVSSTDFFSGYSTSMSLAGKVRYLSSKRRPLQIVVSCPIERNRKIIFAESDPTNMLSFQ